tara:strand:+ start:101 stop:316 length:216 start_codon:yes stop_codon:yes gene_type:complete
MENNMNEEMIDLANRITRSTVAVVDTMTARGAFRGEELSTIGQLRDQCISLIQLVEQEQGAATPEVEDAGE